MRVKKLGRVFCGAPFAWLVLWAMGPFAWASDVTFSGARVGLVEVRSQAWGSWLIISVNDAAGNQIMRLCDTALDKKVMAVPVSDPAAASILSTALMAKASGQSVTGWGIDQVQGNWCGIGNFAVFP